MTQDEIKETKALQAAASAACREADEKARAEQRPLDMIRAFTNGESVPVSRKPERMLSDVPPQFAPDQVRPKHYTSLKPEPIEVINGWNLGFNLGSTIKYIARADLKGTDLEDLKKAKTYIEFEIKKREARS